MYSLVDDRRHGQRSSSADDALAMLNTNRTEEGEEPFALSSTAERLNALRLHVIVFLRIKAELDSDLNISVLYGQSLYHVASF